MFPWMVKTARKSPKIVTLLTVVLYRADNWLIWWGLSRESKGSTRKILNAFRAASRSLGPRALNDFQKPGVVLNWYSIPVYLDGRSKSTRLPALY